MDELQRKLMLKIKPVPETIIIKQYDWFINYFAQAKKPR